MATGEPFPLEELVRQAPSAAREAYLERSAAFEAGELVRSMRERARLSQKELANKVSTSQSHLSEIERGNGLQGPTFSMLRKIANACSFDLRVELTRRPDISESLVGLKISPLAEGLGVSRERAPETFMAFRDRALAALGMPFVENVLAGSDEQIYSYAKWLRVPVEHGW